MRIEKVSGSEERKVLTGMIVDKRVLGRITSKWRKEMFKSRWADIVGQWCRDYYLEYQDAPKGNIQGLFESWASETPDKDTIRLVEKFLEGLSDEYEQLSKESNAEYTLDLAGKHFTRVAIQKAIDQIQGDLDAGKVKKAERRLLDFHKFEMGVGECVDVLEDEDAMEEALEDSLDAIIEYPGDLGRFFRGQMTRDALVAILAPEKRGKSFHLQDHAWRALRQGKKVAFFSVGDLSKKQMMRRFMIRGAQRPLKAKTIRIPTSIKLVDGRPVVKFEEKTFESRLKKKEVKVKMARLREKLRIEEGHPLLKMSVHPMSSISVKGIEAILDDWARDGWVPDVIIIDYADILDMPEGDDDRSKINNTWKALRKLSQTRHCLVITATQADAASYTSKLMDKSNFSEDKRKLAHVTGMYGLNQDPQEKERGIQRLNWIVLREEEFFETQCCYVAGCLSIAAPCMRSAIGFYRPPAEKMAA